MVGGCGHRALDDLRRLHAHAPYPHAAGAASCLFLPRGIIWIRLTAKKKRERSKRSNIK